MRRCLGTLRLMKLFPGGGDRDVLAALGQKLTEVCVDDAAAEELVKVLSSYEQGWPGIAELGSLAEKQRWDRERAEKLRDARAARDAHEASCPGYWIDVDATSRVITVGVCSETFFGSSSADVDNYVGCRRGVTIDCKQIEADEAAKRGEGWITGTEKHRRAIAAENLEFSKRFAERRMADTPGQKT